jgi:hypothetical protein
MLLRVPGATPSPAPAVIVVDTSVWIAALRSDRPEAAALIWSRDGAFERLERQRLVQRFEP